MVIQGLFLGHGPRNFSSIKASSVRAMVLSTQSFFAAGSSGALSESDASPPRLTPRGLNRSLWSLMRASSQ